MHWEPVSSSVIARLRYDAAQETLDVVFRSGKVYRYFRVPAAVYDDWLAADSKGAFFNAVVRDRFEYVEVV